MVPALQAGDIIPAELYTVQPLEVGQIVIFDRGDLPNVCHRILVIRGEYLFLGGDANKYEDGWFHRSKVHWIVRGIYRQQKPGS